MPSSDQQGGSSSDASAGQSIRVKDKSDGSSDANAIPLSAILPDCEIRSHVAENFAQSLLIQPCISVQQLAELCKLLPAEHLTRKSADSRGSVWVSGACQKGGIVGLRTNLDKFPYSTKCFTKFASSQVPNLCFSSLAVLNQHQSALHIDANNSCDHPNWVCPLTSFRGGDVWVESTCGVTSLVHNGETLQGDILPVSCKACFLDASKRHCVLDWDGERIVLACFMIKDFNKLSLAERSRLLDHGFWLPSDQVVANTGSAPAARAKAKAEPVNKQRFAIEVCCGAAGLTAELRKQGLPCSFGIDHVVKAGCKAPIKKIDLTVPGSQDLVKSWVTSGQCCYLHLGIPCGTSSRAREIPGGPPPLRSESSPEGLTGLPAREAERVKQANCLYSFACSLILLCAQFAVEWSLEQPHRSLFWRTVWWRSVLQHIKPFFVFFANCMHGGARPKKTCLATSVPTLVALSRECDNQHAHLSWGKCGLGWSTAAEVEYPHELCKLWSQLLILHLVQQGTIIPVQPSAEDQPHAFSSVSTLSQTRKSPAFMPEFKHVQTLQALKPPDLKVPSTLSTPLLLSLKSGQVRIPQGCKILDALPMCSAPLPGLSTGDSMASAEAPDLAKVDVHSTKWHQIRVAFPFSPEEFVREAVYRGHPCSVFQGVTEALGKAIAANAKLSVSDLIKRRIDFFGHWTTRAKALANDERKLHQSLPMHRREILKGKRLLLMKEMLTELGYRDAALVDDLISGFCLVGQTPEAETLPSTFQPALLSEEDLLRECQDANVAILHSTKSTGDRELDNELWSRSQEEVAKGWLAKVDNLQEALANGRISRRFPLRQGGKVRCIDNYSESQVNDSITITSKVTVDGPDTVAATAAEAIKALSAEGKGTRLKARTLDLKSAYRQLPIADSSLKYARLSIYNPESEKAECFQQYAVPFGARASVVAFIRCARALQWLALQIFLIVTCYFDDYCNIAPEEGCENAETALTMLFDLLGWAYDRDGPKSGSMADTVSLLGVVLNLSQSDKGKVVIENTMSRRQELKEEIEKYLEAGRISLPETARLKGRMTFAEGQLFGRACRSLFNSLGRHLHEHPRGGVLDQDCRVSMSIFLEYLQKGRPRIVDATSKVTFFVFTDAHFDMTNFTGGLGAVLVDNQGRVVQWFSHMLEKDKCKQLAQDDAEQIITELEALGVLAAIHQWRLLLRQKHLVCFLDNEGARGAILKGRSSNALLNSISHQVCEAEDVNCIYSWYARIPSISNLADPPSRGVPRPWLEANKEVSLEASALQCLA